MPLSFALVSSVWLGSSWLACSTPKFADCPDATCRAEQLVQAWDADPAAVESIIVGLPDEVERVVLVGALVEHAPGRTAGLCEALSPGAAKERCARLNDRPHLFTAARPELDAAPGSRPAPGPSRDQLPAATLEVGWSDSAPAGTCAEASDRHACLGAEAADAAAGGRGGLAWAICGLMEEGRWRDECLFRAAERAVVKRHHEGYPDAATLCGLAGDDVNMCHAHTLTFMTPGVARMHAPDPRLAADLVEAAAVVEATWAGQPEVASLFVQRFWAGTLQASVAGAPEVNGGLTALLPASAQPHVRAAAAWRMQQLGQLTGSLEERVGQLEAALARPGAPPEGPSPLRFYPVRTLWPVDLEGHERMPATFFLGPRRRPFSESPAEDMALCVLEVAARAEPPEREVLEQGLQSEVALVAWSAQRLLDGLEAGLGADDPALIRPEEGAQPPPGFAPPGGPPGPRPGGPRPGGPTRGPSDAPRPPNGGRSGG